MGKYTFAEVLAVLLIIIGFFFSLTFVGMIIGIPLMFLGGWMFWWAHTKKTEIRSKELTREAIREERENEKKSAVNQNDTEKASKKE